MLLEFGIGILSGIDTLKPSIFEGAVRVGFLSKVYCRGDVRDYETRWVLTGENFVGG